MIALVPLVVFRLFKAPIFTVFLFFSGFIVSYAVLGTLVAAALSSSVRAGVQVGFGLSFAVSGILSATGHLPTMSSGGDEVRGQPHGLHGQPDPRGVSQRLRDLATGALFAGLVSLNPCTVPFLGVVITSGPTRAFESLLLFAAGLLTPSALALVVGESVVGRLSAIGEGRAAKALVGWMGWVVVAAGLYLALTSGALETGDAVFATAISAASLVAALDGIRGTSFRGRGKGLAIALAVALPLAILARTLTSVDHGREAHDFALSLRAAQVPTAAAGGEDEGLCIDTSLVEPCRPCFEFVMSLAAASTVILTAAISVDPIKRRRARHKKHLLSV